MVLWSRVSLVSFFAAAAVAATGLAWRASSRTCPVAPQALPAPPAASPADEPTPEAIAAGDDGANEGAGEAAAADMTGDTDAVDAPEGAIAGPGDLDLAWLPKSYIRGLTPDQTRELAAFVNGWLDDDQAPSIEYRHGVVRVHSDQDRGDEPPYPRSAAASGQRFCGEPAIWMRDTIRERLHYASPGEITCSHNVCSYGGSEYAPTGYLFFHPATYMDEQIWVLDAWVEVYTSALSEEVATQNTADVVHLMKRVASTSCPGEPAGMY
jgi:hypothetical protein